MSPLPFTNPLQPLPPRLATLKPSTLSWMLANITQLWWIDLLFFGAGGVGLEDLACDPVPDVKHGPQNVVHV